jgi:hypothetical protein
MSHEHDPGELDDRERRLFAMLPRESDVDDRELDRLVTALQGEGLLHPRRRGPHWMVQLAAAIVLLLVGGAIGARIATRNSLETLLRREDLPVSDRILLMQRAGSAYVRAANGYAGAVARTDSTAIEVASRVLIGAAQAVARSDLDGGLSPHLAAALQSRAAGVAPTSPQRVIWF